MTFGKWGELASQYVGPCEILDRIRIIAYTLALPHALEQVYDVLHVFILTRYLSDLVRTM